MPPNRKRLAPRPRAPKSLEARYSAALVGLSRALARDVKKAIAPGLVRTDADVNLGSISFPHLRFNLTRTVARFLPILDRFGRVLVDVNTKEMRRVLRISIADQSLSVQAAASVWRTNNVNLISSISDRLYGDVFDILTEAANSGMRNETLADRIQERFAVSDSRARLIARDQILKGNSSLTQARHREAGITQYVWSTSNDERVREMHRDLNGQTFSWNDPPVTNEQGDTNAPGTDYSCRCVARPILD